jgi:polynucleotide 5'-triphosphatase
MFKADAFLIMPQYHILLDQQCLHERRTAYPTRMKNSPLTSHRSPLLDHMLRSVVSTTEPSSAALIGCVAQPEVLHELEIEIARHDFVLAAAMRRGDPSATEEERNAFDELIRAFVNNARILLRNVPPE